MNKSSGAEGVVAQANTIEILNEVAFKKFGKLSNVFEVINVQLSDCK